MIVRDVDGELCVLSGREGEIRTALEPILGYKACGEIVRHSGQYALCLAVFGEQHSHDDEGGAA